MELRHTLENTLSKLLLLNQSTEWPPYNQLRGVKGNFGGIIIPELEFGFPNKVFYTPGYVCESSRVRQIIRSRYKDAGLVNLPLNTYGTKVYGNYFPDWNYKLINTYLEELLNEELIPICSLYDENSKVLETNAHPDLVPLGFVGWENPSPLGKPEFNDDNLFWKAKQRYSRSLIYWHNPPYQGAPYVNPHDWGYEPGVEFNNVVWQFMVKSGCQGLLFQSRAWEDLTRAIGDINDFADRLLLGKNGYPICDLIDFEETVYYLTVMNGNPLIAIELAEQVRDSVKGLTGYCNG